MLGREGIGDTFAGDAYVGDASVRDAEPARDSRAPNAGGQSDASPASSLEGRDGTGASRNERRRRRYANDVDYRQRAIDHTRQNYRKHHPEMRSEDCRENLVRLEEIGKRRAVALTPERTAVLLTFSKSEMATALGRNVQVLYRWLGSGRWPAPVFRVARGEGLVYTEAEARALLAVFGVHQRDCAYLRREHHDTIDALNAAVLRARREVRAAHEAGTDALARHMPALRTFGTAP